MELAAILFRITQLEHGAHGVGKEVLKKMEKMVGTAPNDLPPAEDIKNDRSTPKGTNKIARE